MTREATCACRKVTVRTSGEPLRISVCHCTECQHRTGSAFGVQARFKRESVEVVGKTREFVRIADSGNRIMYRFCLECGSTVCYELEVVPGVVAVPVGGFADSDFPGPTVSVYESRKHEWVGLPEDIEHND